MQHLLGLSCFFIGSNNLSCNEKGDLGCGKLLTRRMDVRASRSRYPGVSFGGGRGGDIVYKPYNRVP